MSKFIVEIGKDNVTMSEVCRILATHLCTNVGVTEVSDFTFENWKKDVNGDCAENAQTQSCDCCKYISCHLNHGAIYCKLYGERNNSKACKSFVPDSEV